MWAKPWLLLLLSEQNRKVTTGLQQWEPDRVISVNVKWQLEPCYTCDLWQTTSSKTASPYESTRLNRGYCCCQCEMMKWLLNLLLLLWLLLLLLVSEQKVTNIGTERLKLTTNTSIQLKMPTVETLFSLMYCASLVHQQDTYLAVFHFALWIHMSDRNIINSINQAVKKSRFGWCKILTQERRTKMPNSLTTIRQNYYNVKA